jgi:hypothetical protein
MSFTNQTENEILDYVFGGVPYTPPAAYAVGLLINPTEPEQVSGGPVEVIYEPIGNNYTRILIDNDKVTWSAAPLNGHVFNNIEIAFPIASGLWGTVEYVGFFEPVMTGGDLLAYGTIAAPIIIDSDQKVVFNPGDITITLD